MQTGDILVGRYEVDSLLGRGGMSSVFAGFDRTLGREVAIKVLASELVEDSVFVERFDREARAAASLSHRNIVAVFDSGVDGATRFIVMERVPGRTVSAVLREGPMSVEEAVEIAASVASALGAAHARGIVHRDVKPGNVMVGKNGQVKVLDFGIARALAATSLTRATTVIGTAGYLSPEQAEGGPVDARSDVYGLGCVLYEMLAARPPFVADSTAALVHQHLTRPPQPPSRARPEVPPALDAIVLRCLAKDPRERYENAEGLCAALAALPSSPNGHARIVGTARTRVLPGAGGPGSPPGVGRQLGNSPGPKRRRTAAAAVAAVLLAGLALALLLALDRRSGGGSPGSAARASASGSKSSSATNPRRATAHARKPPATATTSAAKPVPPATGSTQTAPPGASEDASGVGAALRSLTLADQQQGLIDSKAARVILRGSAALAQALASGDPGGVAQQLSALGQRIDKLAAKGDIATPATAETLKLAAAGVAGVGATSAPPAGEEPPAQGGAGHGSGRRHEGGAEGSQD